MECQAQHDLTNDTIPHELYILHVASWALQMQASHAFNDNGVTMVLATSPKLAHPCHLLVNRTARTLIQPQAPIAYAAGTDRGRLGRLRRLLGKCCPDSMQDEQTTRCNARMDKAASESYCIEYFFEAVSRAVSYAVRQTCCNLTFEHGCKTASWTEHSSYN